MRIVVADSSLAWLGGAETYALTVAEQLQRLGHDVVIATGERGIAAEMADERGLRVVLLDEVGTEPAVVLAQDAAVGYELAARRPDWPQIHVIHSDIFDSHLPPVIPQLAAVVVLYDRVERRVRAMDIGCPIVRLSQPIEVERFKPTAPLRTEHPVVLALGNYVQGARLEMLSTACERAGATLVHAGSHGGGFTPYPERRINEADIVIGKARVILEAMACGRAAYVYDHNGGEGWVTAENAARLSADNFGGQSEPIVIDADRLAADLSAYDPSLALANRDHVVAHHAASAHAAALVEVLREACSPGSVRVGRDEALELARLTRVYRGADSERFLLKGQLAQVQAEVRDSKHARAEAEAVAEARERARRDVEVRLREVDVHFAKARERIAELEQQLADEQQSALQAQQYVDDMRATRRWQFMQRTLAPLDHLRRRTTS